MLDWFIVIGAIFFLDEPCTIWYYMYSDDKEVDMIELVQNNYNFARCDSLFFGEVVVPMRSGG